MWFNTRSNNSRIDINWPTAVWLIRCHVASYQRSWVLILSCPDFWAVRTSSGEQLQRPELRCLLPRQPDGGHRRPRVPRRIRERGRSQAEEAVGVALLDLAKNRKLGFEELLGLDNFSRSRTKKSTRLLRLLTQLSEDNRHQSRFMDGKSSIPQN